MSEVESGNPRSGFRDHRSLRRNVSALLVDSGAFGGALGFIGYSTVLPAMALALSNSEPFVGLITTIYTGMWLLPQLPAGRWMAGRPYKKPVLLKAAFWSRIGLVFFAIALALNLNPALLAIMLIVVLAAFRGGDAVAAVAWFDIISKVLPPNVRGRVLGWTQSVAFVTMFLSSFVVAWALGSSGPNFPYNYALLMGGAAAATFVSLFALLFLIEPRGDVSNNVSAQMNVQAHVRHIFKTDPAFRLNAIGRLLIGGIGLATPFYVVQAIEVLHVPENSIGLFLAAQTLGGVASSLILGSVSQRRGSHIVIRATMLLALIPPVMALYLNIFARNNSTLAAAGCVLIFAAMGATDGSFLLGFLQQILDIAPPAERTAYTGLANTIGGLTVIAPTIGGLLLQATSFAVLFIVTALFPVLGLLVALRMRRAQPAEWNDAG